MRAGSDDRTRARGRPRVAVPPFGTLAGDVRHHRPGRRGTPRIAVAARHRDPPTRFLEYFAERGHTVVPSASLVPAGDQTLLFTNSGMVQFKDVFRGVETRRYTRAVDVQRCLRVAGKHNDFEEVGRTPRHHTLFEMLGNWSFGDYFKREAIHWAWEFLTRDYGHPRGRGSPPRPTRDDEEAWAVWRDEIGLPPERMASVGRCRRGRRQELLADGRHGPLRAMQRDPLRPRRAPLGGSALHPRPQRALPALAGDLEPGVHGVRPARRKARVPLPFKSVDTGHGPGATGVGRPGRAVQLRHGPVHAHPRADARAPGSRPRRLRVGALQLPGHRRPLPGHHVPHRGRRAPVQRGRGYVLRRIVRRAVRHGRLLGRREPFLAQTAQVVIDTMGDAYPILRERRDGILGAILREETAFARTLDAGTVHLEEALIPLTGAERRRTVARHACPTMRPCCPAMSRSASTTRMGSPST